MESFMEYVSASYAQGGDRFVFLISSVFLFLVGSVLASFAGLVAHRAGVLEEGGFLLPAISNPPSHCESCQKRLSFRELVPVVGWIAGKGRCSCGERVPVRYPVAEGAAGLAAMLVPIWYGGLDAYAWAVLFLIFSGLFVAWIDFDHHIIPEELTWAILFAGLLFSPFEPDPWWRIAGAAVCCGAMWISLSFIGLIKGIDTRAGGDVAMAAAAGAWLGLSMASVYLLISCAAFVLMALPARLRGIEWVPMGPALVVGLLSTALLV